MKHAVPLTKDEVLDKYKTGIQVDQENRISDEVTYLISMLQSKLDQIKVENQYETLGLADSIEHLQSMERLKNY